MTKRPRDPAVSIAILLAVCGAILLVAHTCHADPAPAPAPAAAQLPTWSLGEVMALIALIIASVGAVVDAARAVLHFTAPRTTSTLDDRAAASLDRLHGRISALESALIQTAPVAAAPQPPAAPAAGSGIGAKVAVIGALIVVGVGLGSTGCHSLVVKTAGGIAWDCTSSERKQGVDLLIPLATQLVLNGASPDGKSVDLAPLKAATSKASLMTDLGVTLWCAASEAVAAIANTPPDRALVRQTPAIIDPVVLRAAWTAVKPDAAFVTSVRDAAGNQVVM